MDLDSDLDLDLETLLHPPVNLPRLESRYGEAGATDYRNSEHSLDGHLTPMWSSTLVAPLGPLERGDYVLDYGSGYGDLTHALGMWFQAHGVHIVGYDPAPATAVAIADFANENTRFVKHKAAIPERSCAGAVSARTFCALADPLKEFRYVLSRLKPGASFMAADGIFTAEGLSAGLTGDEFIRHVETVRRNQLVGPDAPQRAKRAMEKAGFHVQGVRRADHLFERMGCEGYVILGRRPI